MTWVLLLSVCVAVVALVHLVLVGTSAGQLLEYQLFHAVEDRWGRAPTGVVAPVVRLLPPLLAAAMLLTAAGCALAPRTRRRGLTALLALAGANVTTQALKAVLPRPDFDNGVPWAGGNSLPSGHTTLVAGAAAAALLLVPARWRASTAVLGAAATAFTGSAAYLEAWHRPSDMAAACAVAAFWGVLVAPWRSGPAQPPRRAGCAVRAVEGLLWALGCAGLAAGLSLLAATLGTAATTASAHPLAAPAGVLLGGAPGLVLVAVLLGMLRSLERR